MKKSVTKRTEKTTYAIVAIAIFFLTWSLVTAFTAVKETTPGPPQILKLLMTSITTSIGGYILYGYLYFSLRRVIIGYLAATIPGTIADIAIGTSRYVETIIEPIFEMLRPIPPIVWIPLITLWFGVEELPKYAITFIGSFTDATLNAYTGAQRADPTLIGCARMLGINGRGIFLRVILPSYIPQILTGMQVMLSAAWMAVLAAGMARAQEDYDWIILCGNDITNIPLALVGMVVISLVGLFLAIVMRAVKRKICSWNIMDVWTILLH